MASRMRRMPALVVGEHPHRFENVAMFAVMDHIAALDEAVDRGAHAEHRVLEPGQFGLRIVGDEVLHHDARIVQHDIAEADAVVEARALEPDGASRRRRRSGRGRRLQIGRGDGLGQHHRGRLQRLDLILGVEAARAVLHDENAEHIAEAQNRHAEEGLIDLLAGFRLVGEGRMRPGVGEVDAAWPPRRRGRRGPRPGASW